MHTPPGIRTRRGQEARRRGPAASARHLFQDLGSAVRAVAASYAVDYFHVQGYLRWGLILVFMMLKAGLIVAVFMHMLWERLAMVYAILVPPLLLLVFVAIGAFEADYTFLTRGTFFGPPAQAAPAAPKHK
jgi:cytochrome c oxidase subunit IV